MTDNTGRITASLFAASAAVATVFTIYEIVTDDASITRTMIFGWVLSFIVALAHGVIFGLPAYAIVKRFKLIRWWMAILCGFFIGALPMTFIVSPWHPGLVEGNVNNVPLVVHGVTTPAGWVSDIESILGAGALGIIGALAALYVWRKMAPGLRIIERPTL